MSGRDRSSRRLRGLELGYWLAPGVRSDPDSDDTRTRTDYAFLLRSADGAVTVAHDTHEFGLFPRALWLRVLADAGFRPRSVAEVTSEDRLPREIFVGTRV